MSSTEPSPGYVYHPPRPQIAKTAGAVTLACGLATLVIAPNFILSFWPLTLLALGTLYGATYWACHHAIFEDRLRTGIVGLELLSRAKGGDQETQIRAMPLIAALAKLRNEANESDVGD